MASKTKEKPATPEKEEVKREKKERIVIETNGTEAISSEEAKELNDALLKLQEEFEKLSDRSRKSMAGDIKEMSKMIGSLDDLMKRVEALNKSKKNQEDMTFWEKAWENAIKPEPDRIGWGVAGILIGAGVRTFLI